VKTVSTPKIFQCTKPPSVMEACFHHGLKRQLLGLFVSQFTLFISKLRVTYKF